MTTCPSCGGLRTITVTIPETKTRVSHPDGWNGKPEHVSYQTGKMVDRNYQCDTCHGRGTVHDVDLAILYRNALIESDRAAQS